MILYGEDANKLKEERSTLICKWGKARMKPLHFHAVGQHDFLAATIAHKLVCNEILINTAEGTIYQESIFSFCLKL